MSKPMIYTTPCTHDDINRLQDDIKTAHPLVLATLKREDNLIVHSVSVLDAPTMASIDSIIANFVDEDLTLKIPAIYDIAKAEASGKHHHNIDYKHEMVSALIPVRTAVQGEVQNVKWYAGMDGTTPEELILNVDVVYSRDGTGMPISRVTTRTWMNRDGTENDDKKITVKYYFVNAVDQIDEGIKRRDMLVKSIQMPIMMMMMQVLMPIGYSQTAVLLKGRQFLDDYEEEFNNFIKQSSSVTDPADENFGRKNVIVMIEDEARVEVVEWLDKAPASLGGATTIRQYLMGEFDI